VNTPGNTFAALSVEFSGKSKDACCVELIMHVFGFVRYLSPLVMVAFNRENERESSRETEKSIGLVGEGQKESAKRAAALGLSICFECRLSREAARSCSPI
jgi:hypothetical protein